MATVSLPYTLQAGQPENVNQLVANLNALVAGINTIDTAQLATDAVTTAKIAANQVTFAKIAPVPFGYIKKTTQSVASGGTGTAVDFDTTVMDNGVATTGTAIADLTNNRLYVRRTGIYMLSVQAKFDSPNYFKYAHIGSSAAGAAVSAISSPADTIFGDIVSSVWVGDSAAGAYFDVTVGHTKGTNADVTTDFQITWLGKSS